MGEFKKTEQVQVTYDKNFMYKYSVYITHGAYATLFTEGTPIEYKGVPCTQMQIEFEGKLITYVFETESSNLVKFVLVDGENIITLEYSDYKFDSIDTECLTLPNTSIQIGTVQLYREVVACHALQVGFVCDSYFQFHVVALCIQRIYGYYALLWGKAAM